MVIRIELSTKEPPVTWRSQMLSFRIAEDIIRTALVNIGTKEEVKDLIRHRDR